MATAAAVLNNFGIDNWNASVYGNLSTTAQISLLVKSRAQSFRVSYLLWRLNGSTAKFFRNVDDILTGRRAVPQTQPYESISNEKLAETRDSLIQLGVGLAKLYEDARQSRSMNNSLLAGPLIALRAHADNFFELAEWFDSFQHMDEIEQAFTRAQEERRLGDVFDLSQVQ